MKRKLLIICSLLVSSFVSKAQDFDLDFYQYFNAHMADYNKTTAKDAATTWRSNKTDGSQGPVVTMNNISASVAQNSRINSLVPNDEAGANGVPYIRFQFGHNDCKIILTSTVDIKTVALMYRGSSDTDAGTFKITYAANAEEFQLANTVYAFPTVTSAAPGQANYYTIPETGIRYIEIQRNSTVNSRLYRIAASSTPFTTLPLNFTSFTAKANGLGNAVNLNWKTANEVNTKQFVVERGTSAADFKSIGTLASQNTAGEHSYKFEDASPLAGTSYYRIKQVDNDGKFSYSEVTKVSIKGSLSLNVYPNPGSEVLNVSHQPAANASLKVFNAQGQSVTDQSISNGATLTKVGISSLASGVYYVVVTNSGEQYTAKFIKN